MSIQTFELRTSLVRTRIDDVISNGHKGTVEVKFSVQDLRHQNCQVILAQYDIGGGYVNMTLTSGSTQKSVDILATSKWTQYSLIWDAKKDIDLQLHSDFKVKIQVQDDDAVNDTAQESDGTHDIDMGVYIEKYVEPLLDLNDTTPEFLFEVPYACHGINMHFTLTISENADLSNPVQTINSFSDQTGWSFQIAGSYVQLVLIGCPDIGAFLPYNSRVKHILQTPLDAAKTYYYQVTVNNIAKKILMSEMDEVPANYPYYPVNLGFDVTLYGQTIDNLDINPEDLINPEFYGP